MFPCTGFFCWLISVDAFLVFEYSPRMFSKCIQILVLSVLFSAPVCADQPQVLLLSNGQVVSGKIKKQDHGYVVYKKSGSRIVFAPEKVVLVCKDFSDLYWQKCALLRASDTAGHVQLFQWCVRHKLVDGAQNQIDLLQDMKVSAKQLHQLDLTLNETRLAMAEDLKRKAHELVQKAQAIESGKRDYAVKQAGYVEDVDREVNSQKGKSTIDANANSESSEVAVDPFDPEVFNEKYVRGQSQDEDDK